MFIVKPNKLIRIDINLIGIIFNSIIFFIHQVLIIYFTTVGHYQKTLSVYF